MRTKAGPAQALALAAATAAVTGLAVAMTPASAAGNPRPHAAAPGMITTIAGSLGGPGPARSVGVNPCAVSFSRQSLYVTDLISAPMFIGTPAVVRKISTASGDLTTVAGNGATADPNLQGAPALPQVPDGSPAKSAAIEDSCGVAVDRSGNVLISDGTVYSDGDEEVAPYGIRVVAAASGKFYGRQMIKGHEYTLVRSSDPSLGDASPGALAVDAAGNVLFTSDNDVIYARAARAGTFYGIKMKAHGIYAVAGGGTTLRNGVAATQASLALIDSEHFSGLVQAALRIDHHGNLVVADEYHGLVRVVAASNGKFYGQSMRAGHIYTIAGDRALRASENDGMLATKTKIIEPGGIAVDHQGNVLLASSPWVLALAESSGKFYGRGMVRGHLYRIIGTNTGAGGVGVPARKAGRVDGSGLSVDGSGNVVIAGDGILRVVPVRTGQYYGQQMLALHIYPLTELPTVPLPLSGDEGPAADAELAVSYPLAHQPSMNLLAGDSLGDRFVVNGALPATIMMVAGTTGIRFGQRVQAGHLYRIAGNGEGASWASGGNANSIGLVGIDGIATDSAGNVLLAENTLARIVVVAASSGTFYGQQMAAGHIYTVAGDGGFGESSDGLPALSSQIGQPTGVASDQAGNLLITSKCEVRVVAAASGTQYGQSMTAGDLYTIAGTATTCSDSADGGVASASTLSSAGMVMTDAAGNILVADASGIRVIAAATGTFYRQSMTAGDLYTVAPAAKGGFTVDGAGNLVVASTLDDSISVLAETTGTFYGVPMTAGQTYQIGGDGFLGHAGDGGPATNATLTQPVSVLATSDGGIVDAEYHWLREIAG